MKNVFGAKTSGAKLSWRQHVLAPKRRRQNVVYPLLLYMEPDNTMKKFRFRASNTYGKLTQDALTQVADALQATIVLHMTYLEAIGQH